MRGLSLLAALVLMAACVVQAAAIHEVQFFRRARRTVEQSGSDTLYLAFAAVDAGSRPTHWTRFGLMIAAKRNYYRLIS